MNREALNTLAIAAVGGIVALALVFIVWHNVWPKSKGAKVLVWSVILAILGAIIGTADENLGTLYGALVGAFWGALLAGLAQTSLSLRR